MQGSSPSNIRRSLHSRVCPRALAYDGRPRRAAFVKARSAVGLVDRLQTLGLVAREQSADDARQVLVQMTAKGERILHKLSIAHRMELGETGPELAAGASGDKP